MKTRRFVSMGICTALLAGCVGVPMPTSLADPEPFTVGNIAQIQIGRTTRAEVRALFRQWTYETDAGIQTVQIDPEASSDDRYWSFGLARQLGDMAFVGLMAYYPVPLPFILGNEDNYEHHWVIVEFDDADTASAVWMTHEGARCADSGACYSAGSLVLIANLAANTAARWRPPVSGECAVYAYADRDFASPVSIANGATPRSVFGKASFQRLDLPSGAHRVSASIEGVDDPSTRTSVVVTCAGNDVHYVALNWRKNAITAVEVDAVDGANAIEERCLVERSVPFKPQHAKPKSVQPL